MILIGEKQYLFLPAQDRCIGPWLALTEIGVGKIRAFLKLGSSISKRQTGLSKRELEQIGYEKKYLIYPIITKLDVTKHLMARGGMTPIPITQVTAHAKYSRLADIISELRCPT